MFAKTKTYCYLVGIIIDGTNNMAALVGAVSGLLLGRFIDAGHGGRAVWLAAGSLAVVIALRAASWRDPVLAVMANAAGAGGD